MTHVLFVAIAICTLPGPCAAQAPEPAGKPIDAKATAEAIEAGMGWLLRHQDEAGGWSASQFQRHDPKTDLCTGTGKPDQDLPVTAWATFASSIVGARPSCRKCERSDSRQSGAVRNSFPGAEPCSKPSARPGPISWSSKSV